MIAVIVVSSFASSCWRRYVDGVAKRDRDHVDRNYQGSISKKDDRVFYAIVYVDPVIHKAPRIVLLAPRRTAWQASTSLHTISFEVY